MSLAGIQATTLTAFPINTFGGDTDTMSHNGLSKSRSLSKHYVLCAEIFGEAFFDFGVALFELVCVRRQKF